MGARLDAGEKAARFDSSWRREANPHASDLHVYTTTIRVSVTVDAGASDEGKRQMRYVEITRSASQMRPVCSRLQRLSGLPLG
jgi:hypothetical protein